MLLLKNLSLVKSCAVLLPIFLVVNSSCLRRSFNHSRTKGIYGIDDRKEVHEVNSDWKALARSTGLLVHRTDLKEIEGDPEHFQLSSKSLAEKHNLCENVKFRDQPSAGFCTGFLTTSDTFVTAGHCLQEEKSCDKIAIVFDYDYANADKRPTRISKKNVYSCKEIVAKSFFSTREDFGVVKLDRVVPDRKALAFRTQGAIKAGDPLTIMGFPTGLPLKIAKGRFAAVQVGSENSPRFSANIDHFEINSGAPVFHSNSRIVEGILVGGWADFVTTDKNCKIYFTCEEDCPGAQSTKITAISRYIPGYSPPYTKSAFREISTAFKASVPRFSKAPPQPLNMLFEGTVSISENVEILDAGLLLDIQTVDASFLEIDLIAPTKTALSIVETFQLRGSNFKNTFGLEGLPSSPLQQLVQKNARGDWRIVIRSNKTTEELKFALQKAELILRAF
jgi:V8-like Glu-specific endopeptidase